MIVVTLGSGHKFSFVGDLSCVEYGDKVVTVNGQTFADVVSVESVEQEVEPTEQPKRHWWSR